MKSFHESFCLFVLLCFFKELTNSLHCKYNPWLFSWKQNTSQYNNNNNNNNNKETKKQITMKKMRKIKTTNSWYSQLCVCVCVCVFACMHVCTCVCTHTYMHSYNIVCMCVLCCVFMSVYIVCIWLWEAPIRPDNLSSIPGTHMIEGENQFYKVFL